VLENVGLASERSTGLPVIPGTGIKGIVSTWACWEANLQADGALPETIAKCDQDRARFSSMAERILGSNAESGSEAAGGIVFLGGFPVTPPTLVLDILTPHARGNPLPNPFLALDPGTRWIFPLLARPRQGDAGKLLQQAEDWLIEALTQVGLGAKTAAGYGRFRLLTTAETAQLETERQAGIAAKAVKQKGIEQEQTRLAAEDAKRAAAEALAKQKVEREALLSPEELAYTKYAEKVTDWTAPAREIAAKSETEKQWILRYFRSEQGRAEIARWPRNDKATKRIQNLKDAGL
jgi:CRISPR-associated protein Cmr6